MQAPRVRIAPAIMGALVAALFLPTFSVAEPSVGAPVVVPAAIAPGVSTALRVTTAIVSGPGDPAVVATGVNLLRVAADGRILATLGSMKDDGTGGDAVARDGVFTLRITVLVAQGDALRIRVTAPFVKRPQRILSPVTQVPFDTTPPSITITAPPAGSSTTETAPEFQVTLADDASGVVAESLAWQVNGASRAMDCQATANGATCTPQAPLAPGSVTAVASVQDRAGNTGTAQVQFTIASPPAGLTLAITDPAEGAVVGASPISVRGSVSDPTARVVVQGALADSTAGAFEMPGVLLTEGPNRLNALARNRQGNEASAARTVTLDTIPPFVSISTPADRSIVVQSPAEIRGIVVDATTATCTLNGALVPVTASSVDLGGQQEFWGSLAVSPGPNVATVTCQDEAGHTSSRSHTVFYDPVPLTVTSVTPSAGAGGVAPSSTVTVTFSEAVASASVRATSFYLRDGSVILPAAVSVAADGASATLTTAGSLPSGKSIRVTVTPGVTDTSGNALSQTFYSTFLTTGAAALPGDLIGEVYDDTRSLPLGGASVEAVVPQTGMLLASGLADNRGRYLLRPGSTQGIVRVTKSGYTTVDRDIITSQGVFSEALDARLTPLAFPTSVNAAAGATLQNGSGDLLSLAPGALAENAGVSLTAVSGQGPRKVFPLGWAPLSIVQIDGPETFVVPATVHFASRVAVPARTGAVVARYDETSRAWMPLALVTTTGEGRAEFGGVPGRGQYALLVADGGTDAPPAASVGQPLASAADTTLPPDATASGKVVPPVGRADDPTPARATVTIVGTTALRSGTWLRGDFVESVMLRAGGEVSPAPTQQDLVAYRFPEDETGRTLTAEFAIAASRVFQLTEITEGTVAVDVSQVARAQRNLIGASGGGVATDDGLQVTVPGGAFAQDVPVTARRLDGATFGLQTAGGLTFLGGVSLDLFGHTSASSLLLTLEGLSSFVPTGARVVIAGIRNVKGQERLVPLALGLVEGDAVTTFTEIDGVALPGVREGGRYGFYALEGELAAVTGLARDAAGRRDGHLVEVDGLPFASVTDGSGAFVSLARPGAFDIIATAATSGDQARVSGATGIALAEIVISPSAPRVTSLVVRPPVLEGNWGGPVVLLGKPALVVDDDALGGTQGNGNGVIEAGERVALTLWVRNNGTSDAGGGTFALRIRGASVAIEVTPETSAAGSLPPSAPVAAGPFTFAVPTGTDVSAFRYSLYYLLPSGAVSTEIPFTLPLGVDHPNVSIGSEVVVTFSEPVTAPSDGAVVIARESGATLTPVETKLLFNEDRTVATIRALAPLPDNSVYRVTLSTAIVDADGRELEGAPVVERFMTEDRTPPATINPGQIDATVPDANGVVRITATSGSVNPDDTVILLNEQTGMTVLVTVRADGGFSTEINADMSDPLVLLVRDRSDNQTRVRVGPFVRRDPLTGAAISAVIDQRGGTFTSPDGVRITVPAGAIGGAAEIKISRFDAPLVLPGDLVGNVRVAESFAQKFTVTARIQLDATASRFAAPIKLAIPAPAGSSVGDIYFLVRTRTVTIGGLLADLDLVTGLTALENPVKTVQRFEILDSATVKDEGGQLVLSTDSPPFDGVLEPDLLTFLKVNGPMTLFAGTVRRDSAAGTPVAGAIVRSIPRIDASSAFASVTNGQGEFVVADAAAGGPHAAAAVVSGRLDVYDEAFTRVIRRDVAGVVGEPAPPGLVIAHLSEDFVLPTKLPSAIRDVLGDVEPPRVTLRLDGAGLNGGFATIGRPLTVTVTADDDDQVEAVGLRVDSGTSFEDRLLDDGGTHSLTPVVNGLITFRGWARDRSGNQTSTDVTIRALANSNDGEVTSLPGQRPKLIEPPLGNRTCTFDGECVQGFSEPLDPRTVDVTSVRMTDPEGQLVAIKVRVEGAFVHISPKRNLRFGARYTIVLTEQIRDVDGDQAYSTTLYCDVPQPVKLTTIPLPNATDIALAGDDVLVAISHPVAALNADTNEQGELRTYRLRDDEGNLLATPQLLGTTKTQGRPFSLAADGDRAWVGNRYIGPPATASMVSNPFTFLGLGGGGVLGCGTNPLNCVSGFSFVWSSLPTIPSNLEVFDLSDPTKPTTVGSKELNHLVPLEPDKVSTQSPTLWNMNAFPIRTQKVGDRIGVVNAFNNLELFTTDDVPASQGVIERVDGPMMFSGRCQGGQNDGMSCTVGYLDPLGLQGRAQCREGTCRPHNEFLNATLFDAFAVSLEAEGVRVISTDPSLFGLASADRTIATFPIGGAQIGRIGSVHGFDWEDENGGIMTSDLAFISGTNDRFAVLDVTEPSSPKEMGWLTVPLGSLSLDACSGVAYVNSSDGSFHAIDFNDPSSPAELNLPGANQSPFSVGAIGTPYQGNVNRLGQLLLADRHGISLVRTRGAVPLLPFGAENTVVAQPQAVSLPVQVEGGKRTNPCGFACSLKVDVVEPDPYEHGSDRTRPGELLGDADALSKSGRSVFGVAADGNSLLILRFEGCPDYFYRFEIDGADSSEFRGALAAPGRRPVDADSIDLFSGENGHVVALYRAPSLFARKVGDQAKIRYVRIKLFVHTRDGVWSELTSFIIAIVRTPVVLVHGLWDSNDLWRDSGMNEFLKSHGFDVTLAEYKHRNAKTFHPRAKFKTANAVYEAVTEALDHHRSRGFAGGLVDVVAHSMGGLVTRAFAAQPLCPDDFATLPPGQPCYGEPRDLWLGAIRRFVTLGTPHLGSPWADQFVENWNRRVRLADLPFGLAEALRVFFATTYHLMNIVEVEVWQISDFLSRPILEGAIHDLRAGSPALKALGGTCGHESMQAHAVVGLWEPTQGDPMTVADFAVRAMFGGLTISQMFGTGDHDLLVTRNSQAGGLPSNAVREFSGIVHTMSWYEPLRWFSDEAYTAKWAETETGNSQVQQYVAHLLDGRSSAAFACFPESPAR